MLGSAAAAVNVGSIAPCPPAACLEARAIDPQLEMPRVEKPYQAGYADLLSLLWSERPFAFIS
ncbi:MAG: hypothetical protein ACT6R2_19835, partial [Blastomonas fulva]|uniref:hypothetical protein n=1 Tax=Blastomonas fulva TaxID=1550728 RepID=UPI0040335E61